MKVKNVLYIGDNVLYLKSKKDSNIIKYKVSKGILCNGKIVNYIKFNKIYEKLLNEYNLNNKLFGETIRIIVNSNYSLMDINILKNIFSYFNYRKVIVDVETKYYKLNKDRVYLNIFDNYSTLTYLDEYKKTNNIFIPSNMFFAEDDYLKYIKYVVKDKELYLLGEGSLLDVTFKKFEDLFNNKTYIFSDANTYLIKRASL